MTLSSCPQSFHVEFVLSRKPNQQGYTSPLYQFSSVTFYPVFFWAFLGFPQLISSQILRREPKAHSSNIHLRCRKELIHVNSPNRCLKNACGQTPRGTFLIQSIALFGMPFMSLTDYFWTSYKTESSIFNLE